MRHVDEEPGTRGLRAVPVRKTAARAAAVLLSAALVSTALVSTALASTALARGVPGHARWRPARHRRGQGRRR